MRARMWGLAIGLAASALLGGTACGDDEPGTVRVIGEPSAVADPVAEADPTAVELAAGETAQQVAVVLDEWLVAPETLAVAAGVIEFVVANDGEIEHELVVIKSEVAADELEVVDGTVPESGVDFRGEVEEFSAGETASGLFRLEAGRHLLICNIAQHYEDGMVAEFTVK